MKMHINPGVSSMPKVDVLEQRADYIKSRSEYSNGFIMISEINAGEISIRANYHFVRELDDSLTPDLNNPNHSFVDEK